MWKKAMVALALFCLVVPVSAMAQSDDTDLQIHLRRSFGYQSGSRIQGSFSLEASSDLVLKEVTYLIDGAVLASAAQAPFRVSFSTGDYQPGEHGLRATAIRESGERIESKIIQVTFVTAEEGWQSGGRIAGWILGGIVALMLVGMLGTALLSRGGTRFILGNYGAAGAAVCGRCQLPVPRHVLSPNLVLGKLERCPHCGRVAILPRAGQQALNEAEARYRQDQERGRRGPERDTQGSYEQMLDDSRFDP